MGRWERFIAWVSEPDYAHVAQESIGHIRQSLRATHEDNLDVVRPLEAKQVKWIILAAARKGGKV